MSVAAADLPWRPCVGVTLINPAGLIFAGRRIDSAAPAWQMPQGGIDPGEAPHHAALRELSEETGIRPDRVQILSRTPDWLTYDLPPELLGKVWGGKYRGQRQKWYLMRFQGQDDEIDIAREPAEFSEWRWIGADDMIAAIVPFKRDIYRAVVDRFRPWLA